MKRIVTPISVLIWTYNTTFAQKNVEGFEEIPLETVGSEQEKGRSKKENTSRSTALQDGGQFFMGGGAGVGIQQGKPNYSLDMPTFNDKYAQGIYPYIYYVVGGRWNSQHDFALRLAFTQSGSGFGFSDSNGVGLGFNSRVSHLLYQFQYGYNFIATKRVWVGAYVLLGLSSEFLSSNGVYEGKQSLSYENAIGEPIEHVAYVYKADRELLRSLGIAGGVGLQAGVAVLPQNLHVGIECGWNLASNYNEVYEISYEYKDGQTEQVYEQTAGSRLNNLNMSINVIYIGFSSY
jgi:hypothetical protein